MSAKTISVALTIVESSRPATAGTVEAVELTLGGRARRALLRLGVLWLVAVGCVFIPILHFVLVPALLVLGPVAAVHASRARVLLQSGSVGCPKCTAPVTVEAGAPGWPARLYCRACGTVIEARPA